MKELGNLYYACSQNGYIKYENIDVNNKRINNQIPISSRCNEILPYNAHRINETIKQDEKEEEETIINLKQETSTLSVNSIQTKHTHFPSFTELPEIIMQKDEVYSIHLDEKSLSPKRQDKGRTNTMIQSSITYVNRDSRKNSLNYLQNYDDKSTKKSPQFSGIFSQKSPTKNIQKSKLYLNYPQTQRKIPTVQSDYEQLSEKTRYKEQKKIKKRSQIVKFDDNQSETEEDWPIIINYRKNKHSRNRPTIIQLDDSDDKAHCCNCSKALKQVSSNSQAPSEIFELHEKLNEMTSNMEYLQQKLEQQEKKFQRQLLEKELQGKIKMIQSIEKENSRLRDFNDKIKLESLKETGNIEQKMNQMQNGGIKNTFLMGFVFSIMIVSIMANLRTMAC